jgi:hypothetical protein
MSVVALSALTLLLACSSTASAKQRIQSITFIALGLISSRILLALWFYLFEYKLTSRFDFVFGSGLNFFINHHGHSLREFGLIPGITVDGLRVFAVVIASTYTLMLASWIDCLSPSIKHWHDLVGACIKRVSRLLDSHALRIGLGFPTMAAWLFFIGLSAKKGLFINELPLLHLRLFGIRFLDYALVICSIIIFFVLTMPKTHARPYLVRTSKFIFILPLSIIGVQYLRQNLAENTYLPFSLKVLFLSLALGLAFVGTNIQLSHVTRYARKGMALFKKRSN